MPPTRHPFAEALLTWGGTVDRPMPWRGERDPYRIWLSEVILQQTRVAQGIDYYLRFVARFPTVADLAAADEDEVLALWRGLGYYRRARNLHAAARQVAAAGGRFPDTAAGLLELPGVGPYSAAAIASFAYGEPVAVVDGNVYRVLARHFGLDAHIDKPAGQRAFRELAARLLPADAPAAYNQAIMDFGALACTPRRPSCGTCPVRDTCVALAEDRVGELPRKAGKPRRRERYLDYVDLLRADGARLVRRRPADDIWGGLYDLPVLDGTAGFAERPAVQSLAAELLGGAPSGEPDVSGTLRHVLSHQTLHARYWRWFVAATVVDGDLPEGYRWMPRAELDAAGIPRLLERYLAGADGALAL